MIDYTVKSGETLADIADQHGFLWQGLWDDPANEGLRVKRKYPTNLQPGDVVRIPDRHVRNEACVTGQVHTFRKRRKPLLHWIELELLDDAGHPQGQEPYWIRLPDGAIREGSLDDDGLVRIDWIPPGVCLVKFPKIDGNECELPVYTSEPAAAWIELYLIDQNNQPLGGEPYSIQLPNGESRQGRLDSNGLARIEGIAPGMCTVRFTNIDRSEWVLHAKPSSPSA